MWIEFLQPYKGTGNQAGECVDAEPSFARCMISAGIARQCVEPLAVSVPIEDDAPAGPEWGEEPLSDEG